MCVCLGPTCVCAWAYGVGRQALRYVAVASCRLPPLLARIRNSAQSQPTACTARPGPALPKGSNKVQSLTRLPQTRPSTSTVPTTGDCASTLVPDEAPRQPSGPSLPSGLTSSLVVAACASSHRRHRTRASVAVQRPAHGREQHFPSRSPASLFYFRLFCRCRPLFPPEALLPFWNVSVPLLRDQHWATGPPTCDPIGFWSGRWQYGVRSVQSVSIIDRDCGTSDMSPPAWDLEAQLRISEPPKISCRGATNHLPCSASLPSQSLEAHRRNLSH